MRQFYSPFAAAAMVAALLCAGATPARAEVCGNGLISTSEECDDGNKASGDGCSRNCDIEQGFDCIGSHPSICAPIVCGDGIVSSGEDCDDGNRRNGDGCSTGCTVQQGYDCIGIHPSECDLIECGNGIVQSGEQCDGSNCCDTDCTFRDRGDVCRASKGICDMEEVCSGRSASCPPDANSDRVCRAAQGACDRAEFCGPSSIDCPPDIKSGNEKICRDADEACDAAERCDGVSNMCPADDVAQETKVCRAARGGCDVAESCNGVETSCPPDNWRGAGAICRPAVSPACDVAETCSGTSPQCPADTLIGCPDTDDIECIVPSCDVSGECTTRDECVEICRQPPFWGNRSGEEKGRLNVTQDVLDQVGPLEICGQSIDSTDLGDLDSAVEALCVRSQGMEVRSLFRALVTTALNCAISEGGSCEQIVARFVDVSFNQCNALCEAGSTGVQVDKCVDQLFCFNRGGRTFDGQCALGTCRDDPGVLCGDDFNSCTPDDDDSDCMPFEGNCSDARLCTNGLETPADICFSGRVLPSSAQLCRAARRNSCTIDSCE